MDEATRHHWEQVADRCFDRAYEAAQRALASKAGKTDKVRHEAHTRNAAAS